jgi:dipeptidyl aminopeptidase/acylaminoacyl peptidase
MTTSHRIFLLALAASTLLAPRSARAQGTAADYARSAALGDRLSGLVVNDPGDPNWIGESDRFWYRKTVTGGHEFTLVDATRLTKSPAFDHARLAESLGRARGRSYTAVTLPFDEIEFTDDGGALRFTVSNRDQRSGAPQPFIQGETPPPDTVWQCTLDTYACTRVGPAEQNRGRRGFGQGRQREARPAVSPDGSTEAFIRNYNVWIRPVGSRQATPLSLDGSEGNAYTLGSLEWSPDSRHLAAYRVTPGYERMVHYIESSPADQVQPKYSERRYIKPGDVLPVEQPVLFDIGAQKQIIIDNALFPNAYSMSDPEWREDGRAFTFEYNQRGHQVYRVIEVDAETGAARAVISEEPKTFFNYREANGRLSDSGKKFRFDLDDGREVIWMSERDGWNHLYLYDGVTGKVKNQITKGEWVVRAVDSVDVANRRIFFRAGGMNHDQDPYFTHYYSIGFDGTGLIAYTDANGDHSVVWSPDHRFYVDSWSRVDQPPISQLRRTSDRKVIMELEKADASALLASGWRPPEVFVAKGRDGTTDIWGVIIRPINFDPDRKYPVIENIYAGPQGSFVPKDFSTNIGMQRIAELGFIVVQIDGMGTSNRSKAFHDVAWKNLGDAGFPDRILWHKAVAAKYPYYDLSRVGIYGTSAGGQSSMGALLFHPEFYDVAVSASGCHDNRMDKIWWNEQWMGWPIGPQYSASSNVDNAWRLRGKLMLIVGEMDTNVDPASTYQVADALIKADKMFDLLVIPGANHTSGGAYGNEKRMDFFVHNLLGVEPPDRNAVVVKAQLGGQ